MEFDLSKLNPKQLSEGECKFLREMAKAENLAPFYAGSFWLEQVVLQKFREKWSELNEFENIALIRVGSGSRLDGGGYGDNELIFLAKTSTTDNSLSDDKHLPYVNFINRPLTIFAGPTRGEIVIEAPLIEYKLIDADECLSRYSGSFGFHNLTLEVLQGHEQLPRIEGDLYPERILDANFVAGNHDIWLQAKYKVLTEIKENRKVLIRMRKRRQAAKKICETGQQIFKGRSLRQFDPEQGIFFYDPANYLNGMKLSFMRYVQLGFTIKILEYIKKESIGTSDIIDLPSPVEDKIRYIMRRGWSNDDSALIDIGIGYTMAANLNISLKFNYVMNNMYKQVPEAEQLSFGKDYFDKMRNKIMRSLESDLLK